MFASADGSRWRRPVGLVTLLAVAGWLVPAEPAPAAAYGRRCERFMLANNAEATVCALVESRAGRTGLRGVGTIAVDRGTATMEIHYVHLFDGDVQVQTAGHKKAEEAAELKQITGWDAPRHTRYRAEMGYWVGIRGGGGQPGTISSKDD